MIPWLIFALLMAAKLLIDYRQWLNKKRIDHDIEAGVLAALLIIPALMLYPWWLSYPMLAAELPDAGGVGVADRGYGDGPAAHPRSFLPRHHRENG